MSDMDKIKRKLASLMERTAERGFTETEVADAAVSIKAILKKYGLSLGDVQAYRDGKGRTKLTFGQYQPQDRIHETVWASEAIGKYFDVRGGEMPTEDGKSTFTVFIGFDEDVAAALSLYHLIRVSSDTSYAAFVAGEGAGEIKRGVPEDRVRTSFMSGYMQRINIRLRELTEQDVITTGTALVVLKEKTIDEALAGVGLEPEQKVDLYRADQKSYETGMAEADKVALTDQLGETKKIATGS